MQRTLTDEGRLLFQKARIKLDGFQYCGQAVALAERGEFRQSIQSASKALVIGQQQDNASLVAAAKRDLAITYSYAGHLARAEEYARAALEQPCSVIQAQANGTALLTLPMTATFRPSIARDVTFESSNVYEKNVGSPRLCVGTGPLASGAGGAENNDMLALEWPRVRVSQNLSNCIDLGQRNACSDF